MDNNQQPKSEQELLLLLNDIEAKLADIKGRWPAHSVQAKMVADLEDMEEERDRIVHLIKLILH